MAKLASHNYDVDVAIDDMFGGLGPQAAGAIGLGWAVEWVGGRAFRVVGFQVLWVTVLGFHWVCIQLHFHFLVINLF